MSNSEMPEHLRGTAEQLERTERKLRRLYQLTTLTDETQGESQINLPALDSMKPLRPESVTLGSQGRRPGKERKGDGALLAGRSAVRFETAEEYLGIKERQRQALVKKGALIVVGKGHGRKITTESLKEYLLPENPQKPAVTRSNPQ
jgi:hypothetical protein